MKKFTVIIMVTVLFTLSVSCLAYDEYTANDKIYKKIEQAQRQAERSNKDDKKIADKLVKQTDKIADKVDAPKEYIEVQIGEVTVMVDPVHVVAY